MIEGTISLVTDVISSEDGTHTYEIRKTWDNSQKKGLIIELYPTLSYKECICMDLSTMHLMNHVTDFGWGSVRIVNLYSTIYNSKPLAKTLGTDTKNIAYIMDILDNSDISEYDIVIAWGSSLSSNKKTIEKKLDLLNMMKEKKLSKQVKCIVSEYMDEDVPCGVHPLFLGLHHAKDKWSLKSFPVTITITELSKQLNDKQPTKKVTKKHSKKEVTSDVPETNEQT